MTDAEETYYTKDRWQNWLTRVEEEELDPENEDSARLLLNLQDDAAIAVAKILTDYEDGPLDEEATLDELTGVREIVLDDIDIDDEETVMLIDGVQTSLLCVFYAAEEFVAEGARTMRPSRYTKPPRTRKPKRTSTRHWATECRPARRSLAGRSSRWRSLRTSNTDSSPSGSTDLTVSRPQ